MIAVLLFHAEIPWAQGGFLGVSSFFTLSGFLITRLLIDEWQASQMIDLRRFWARRFRRLMPASLLALALVLLFGHSGATLGQFSRLRGDVWSALTYVSNWRFMPQARSYFEIFDRPSPVQHFWSLSIEEQFYLCFPLLVLGVCRRAADPVRKLAVVLLALGAAGVAAGIALTAAGAPPARIYYGTDTRAPELLVGAVLALWMASRRNDSTLRASTDAAAVVGAVVLFMGIVWLREDASPLAHGGLLANAIATAAVVHAGVRPSRIGRLLAVWPLVWLGRISYGIYVYHWPVYLSLDAERTGLTLLPLFALRAGITIALAAASYVVVERPIRASPPTVIWNLGESACAIGRGGGRPTLRRFPQMDNHCLGWVTSWSNAVERLDPDVVVVHTGPLDLVDRRLDRWGGVRGPGDPEFEAWLLGELQAAADVLGSRGARLVWLTTPCPGPPTASSPLHATGALDPSRIARLNAFILPSLWTSSGGPLQLFDLYGISCPKGEFQRWIPGTRTPLRSDHLHFSEPGAVWIAERLGPIVTAAARIRRGDH